MKKRIPLLLTCILILGVGAWTVRKSSPQQQAKPQVVNKTQSFQVEELVLNAERNAYLLTLKNGYNKSINGYSIGVGSSKLDVDLTSGERTIAPGGTTQESIPASRLHADGVNGLPLNTINVLAVMFDDGSSDGDSPAIAIIRQRRLGIKLQLQRINSILESNTASSGSVTPITLGQIRQQISTLSIEPSAGQSPMVRSGLKSAKEDLLLEIDALKQKPGQYEEGLQKIKSKAYRRASSL